MEIAFGVMMVAGWALPAGLLGWFMVRSIRRKLRWVNSADALEKAHLEGVGLVAMARVRSVEPWPAIEPLVEVETFSTGGKSRHTRSYPRVGVRLVLELLPLGAPQPVVVERAQTVREAELGRLAPGAFVSVLYDPQQPARFHLDTVERGQMITGATLRTQQAERQMAASRQWAGFPPG